MPESEARKEYKRQWLKNNKDKTHQYYMKNREKYMAYTKAWRANNAERARATENRWNANNPDKLYARHQRYYEKNKERCLSKSRAWYDKNREYALEWAKRYFQENKERIYEVTNKQLRGRYWRLRMELFVILGGPKCVACGYDKDIRALQFDHILGGGYRERKKWHRPHSWMRDSIKNPEEARKLYQILCANCNQIKRYKNNEFYKPSVMV